MTARNVVYETATGLVFKHGYCDFSNDPDYDPALHTIVESDQLLDPQHKWFWDSEAEQFGFDGLEAAKCEKHGQIDGKTDAMIKAGFEFPPASGDRFELSLEAQSRMNALLTLADDPDITYPILWNTIDDSKQITIPDSDTVKLFCKTAVGYYRAAVDSGTAIKDQVRAATTISEVNGIIDNR